MTQRLRRTDNLLRHRISRNANEEDAARLTIADRAADMIAEFGGSWKFIGASICFSLFWIVFNSCSSSPSSRLRSVSLRPSQSRPRHGRGLAGAHHHDVAEPPGRKRPAPGRSRLSGEPEKRTSPHRSPAPFGEISRQPLAISAGGFREERAWRSAITCSPLPTDRETVPCAL